MIETLQVQLDDETPCSWADFAAANDDDPEFLEEVFEALIELAIGESMTLGGGAGAEFRLKRTR